MLVIESVEWDLPIKKVSAARNLVISSATETQIIRWL